MRSQQRMLNPAVTIDTQLICSKIQKPTFQTWLFSHPFDLYLLQYIQYTQLFKKIKF